MRKVRYGHSQDEIFFRLIDKFGLNLVEANFMTPLCNLSKNLLFLSQYTTKNISESSIKDSKLIYIIKSIAGIKKLVVSQKNHETNYYVDEHIFQITRSCIINNNKNPLAVIIEQYYDVSHSSLNYIPPYRQMYLEFVNVGMPQFNYEISRIISSIEDLCNLFIEKNKKDCTLALILELDALIIIREDGDNGENIFRVLFLKILNDEPDFFKELILENRNDLSLDERSFDFRNIVKGIL